MQTIRDSPSAVGRWGVYVFVRRFILFYHPMSYTQTYTHTHIVASTPRDYTIHSNFSLDENDDLFEIDDVDTHDYNIPQLVRDSDDEQEDELDELLSPLLLPTYNPYTSTTYSTTQPTTHLPPKRQLSFDSVLNNQGLNVKNINVTTHNYNLWLSNK